MIQFWLGGRLKLAPTVGSILYDSDLSVVQALAPSHEVDRFILDGRLKPPLQYVEMELIDTF